MKPFRFFQKEQPQLNLPTQERFMELANHQVENPPEFEVIEHQHRIGRHPQIYTEMLRVDVPLNVILADHINHIKRTQEQRLLSNLSDTLDFRHEIIHQDNNGFTIRTELFI